MAGRRVTMVIPDETMKKIKFFERKLNITVNRSAVCAKALGKKVEQLRELYRAQKAEK